MRCFMWVRSSSGEENLGKRWGWRSDMACSSRVGSQSCRGRRRGVARPTGARISASGSASTAARGRARRWRGGRGRRRASRGRRGRVPRCGRRRPRPAPCGGQPRLPSSSPPSSMSTPPRSRLSNTNGTSMAWQAPSAPPWRSSAVEPVHRHPGRVGGLGLGQPDGGHAEHVVGHHRGQQPVGVGAGAGVAGRPRARRPPGRRRPGGPGGAAAGPRRGARHAGPQVEQVPLVGSGARRPGARRRRCRPARPRAAAGAARRRRPRAGTSARRRPAPVARPRPTRCSMVAWARRMSSTGRASQTIGGVGERSSAARNPPVTHSAASVAWSCARRPALGDGRRGTGPAAAGVPSSVPTLMPPADSPKIVTLPGSPPKAAMLSRTHSQRGDLVEDAVGARAGEGGVEMAEVQEAEGAEPVVDRDHHDVAGAAEVGAVVPGRRARAAEKPPPWIHTITGRAASSSAGRVHVEDQAVLVADRCSWAPSIASSGDGFWGAMGPNRWRRARRPRARPAGAAGTARPGRRGCRGTAGRRASRAPTLPARCRRSPRRC